MHLGSSAAPGRQLSDCSVLMTDMMVLTVSIAADNVAMCSLLDSFFSFVPQAVSVAAE
ncbi:hypothetical protein BTZ20_3741 [Rhodococcus sp. MTM3W5.2]|nr:hypothetical protein BTZ20_3741 [Rhodococcus sp. MTM3W5.2]